MDNNNDLVDIGLICIIISATCIMLRRRRRWWVRPWLNEGSAGNLVLTKDFLLNDDPESYKNFLRLTKNEFEEILHLIKADIEKENTSFRTSIPAEDRLIITLRYLATGETFKSLSYSFRVGHSTISQIVPEVCAALFQNLKSTYLKIPNTVPEWLDISTDFMVRWNMPNCLGALDGKHILIRPPLSEGSAYFNYKGTHSIVLLGMVDANYKFLYVDIGANGKISDGGVFRNSTLAAAIQQNSLNFPEDRPLPGREKSVPFVIVADGAFPLSTHIMKPFPYRNMSPEQQIFNKRLSRARRVVENAFGILANRFRIFLNPINLIPDKAQLITQTAIVLHNYLLHKRPLLIFDEETENIDQRYSFRYGLIQQAGNRSTIQAQVIRAEFLDYFNGVGVI